MMTIIHPTADTIERLIATVGKANAITSPTEMQPYLKEWRDRWVGKAAAILKPGKVEEVAQILAIANETRTAIVAQGGNTGLVGGQIPFDTGHEIVLSLTRLNRIRELDAVDNSIIVEAGATLKSVQDAAAAAERLFPLSLGSEGSCTIGGNLATNAGGIGVVAYGNARALTLGLEVVLASGQIWNGLRRLRKDNTGYDLKDIFIGSEGTLGVITAAVLTLFPQPSDRATALVGVNDVQAALDLYHLAGRIGGGRVTGMELLPLRGIEFVVKHSPLRNPLSVRAPWYALIEIAGFGPLGLLRAALEQMLGEAFDRQMLSDAVVAHSQAQARELWSIREMLPIVQKAEGGSIKHDVSVPPSKLSQFLSEAIAAVERLIPGARPVPFGHIGDGNIHFNITQPKGADREAFVARWDEVSRAVFEVVLRLGGSISAEHGIGRLKRDLMPIIKSPVELAMMRGVKRLLDPNGIMNPGKLLPDGE
jgi:FAD/FMN-containing dehydrogenase